MGGQGGCEGPSRHWWGARSRRLLLVGVTVATRRVALEAVHRHAGAHRVTHWHAQVLVRAVWRHHVICHLWQGQRPLKWRMRVRAVGHPVRHHTQYHGAVVQEARIFLLDWDSEVLELDQFWSWSQMRELGVVVWMGKTVVSGILEGVVADQMVHHVVPLDADGLLDQPPLLERVRVNKRPQERSLSLVVQGSGSAGRGVVRGAVLHFRLAIPLPLDCSLLVAGREVLVEFSVDQIVAQNPTGTPVLTVGPSFYSGRRFLVDEDVSAADKVLALSVVGTAGCVQENSSQAGFDDLQGVDGGHDHAAPGGRQNIARRC